MSLDAAIRRLRPHKRTLGSRALLTADEASKALGTPVWQIVNLNPVIIGKRVYRYRARDLGLLHPKAQDATVPQVAFRWGVSTGVVRRMIAARKLEIRSPFDRPLVVTGKSIRQREKARA